jgi:hypothetical protein
VIGVKNGEYHMWMIPLVVVASCWCSVGADVVIGVKNGEYHMWMIAI